MITQSAPSSSIRVFHYIYFFSIMVRSLAHLNVVAVPAFVGTELVAVIFLSGSMLVITIIIVISRNYTNYDYMYLVYYIFSF